MSDIWSTIFLFVSSGTRISKHLLPASKWNIGIFLFLAEITDKQLFVSPKTKNASGLKLSKIGSILINISPIVFDGVPLAASR